MPPLPRFTAKTLAFLRALERHNDRDWFRAHKEAYETDVHAPMVAFVERLALDLSAFAPELVASPRVSIYRIYRDTRFSADKRPLKTHLAAIFPCRGLERHRGASLYFHVSPAEALIAGGMYRPEGGDLALVRRHLADEFPRFRRIVEAPGFRRLFGGVDGEALQRTPPGYPRDHPAAHYLRFRQFLVSQAHPAGVAAGPRFYATLVARFRAIAPFVRFLNEPLLATAALTDPLLAPSPAGRRRSA